MRSTLLPDENPSAARALSSATPSHCPNFAQKLDCPSATERSVAVALRRNES